MIFRCAPMSCCRSSAFSATRYAAAHDVGASPTTNRRTSITWRRTATVSVFTANFVKELKIVGAEVERERRAKVIAAEGEYQAAQRLADAAAIWRRSRSLSSSASADPRGNRFGEQLGDHLPGAGRHSEAVPGVDEPPPADRRTYAADNYARRSARV